MFNTFAQITKPKDEDESEDMLETKKDLEAYENISQENSFNLEHFQKQLKETHLTMDEIKSLTRWMACFCVVTFDIELGQG